MLTERGLGCTRSTRGSRASGRDWLLLFAFAEEGSDPLDAVSRRSGLVLASFPAATKRRTVVLRVPFSLNRCSLCINVCGKSIEISYAKRTAFQFKIKLLNASASLVMASVVSAIEALSEISVKVELSF